jgi:GNAT superfamily N-acetyltransferase
MNPSSPDKHDEHHTIDSVVLRDDLSLATVTLTYDGQPITFRPVSKGDVQILGDYFLSLTAETKRRYGPHSFDRATAEQLCATTDPAKVLRMIATTNGPESERVIAYMIVILGVREEDVARYTKLGIPLHADTDCTFAPSVADAYQGKGLGSILMVELKRIMCRLGRQRMVLWEGTQATNARAIHFYHKHGFRTVGEFEEPPGFNNYDMIMDL